MHEELDVCEDGILAGGQGRSGEDISVARNFFAFMFVAVVVVPTLVAILAGIFFGWHVFMPR